MHHASPDLNGSAQHDQDSEDDCCETVDTHCTSLCYWACAYTSAPPQSALSRTTGLLHAAPAASLIGSLQPWVPPIPTPPPIHTAITLA